MMDVPSVAAEFGIKVETIKRVSHAVLSNVFILNNAYVLRSRSLEGNTLLRFKSEFDLLNHIRTRVNLLFPQFLQTKEGTPYFVTTDLLWTAYPLIPGEVGCNWWELHKLPPEDAQHVFAALRDLHEDTLGTLAEISSNNQYHFLDEVRHYFKRHSETLSLKERNRVRAALEYVTSLEERISDKEKSFVHGDYHPGNIVFRDGAIVGLLDLDWSRKGDGVEDLAFTTMMFMRNYQEEEFLFSEDKFEKCLTWYGLEIARKRLLTEYLILYVFYDFCLFEILETLPMPKKMRFFQKMFLTDVCTRFP